MAMIEIGPAVATESMFELGVDVLKLRWVFCRSRSMRSIVGIFPPGLALCCLPDCKYHDRLLYESNSTHSSPERW